MAPGNPLIGVMLAYTPLHHLLFERQDPDVAAPPMPPLVMTSGNVGGAPITYRDDEAVERLGPLCDALLTHDRPIHVPCDDSVVRVMGDRLLPIRRSRGYAPVPVAFPGARRRVLAVGGELKNTFCITSGDHAWVSQHIGDMENLETLDAFGATVELFETMYAVAPDVVAADAHPRYLSSRWARTSGRGPVVDVQHHHAHVAAVMAEHQLDPTATSSASPSTAPATAPTAPSGAAKCWSPTAARSDRVAHLAYVPLPGGDAAIRHPCRVALAHLERPALPGPPTLRRSQTRRGGTGPPRRQFEPERGCVPTSSMGRLFDAVSRCRPAAHVTYEAQAAIDLEFAAMAGQELAPEYRFAVYGSRVRQQIDPHRCSRGIVDDLRQRVPGPTSPHVPRRRRRPHRHRGATRSEPTAAGHGGADRWGVPESPADRTPR